MDFLTYLPDVFTGLNFTILLLGTIGGLILGAIPGLSPTMAVALLIPFTFKFPPESGLILLGAVYTSTVAGGAVSAILVNIPGAPANIATVFDGHPMAKSGRATEALHYCFISSLVGGILGVLVLIFFTPHLAGFVLQFGPSELFWTAILGVTVIGSLASQSVLKGLLAGAFGLFISTIGYDPVVGVERFVFSDHLTGGVNIIAALIGLFAIPQIFTLLENKESKSSVGLYQLKRHSLFRSLAVNMRRIRALLIGSSTGIIVGLIPGAGGQISGLIAYDQTRKFSKNPQAFGSGEPDGVISVESANNAMVGPSLVPLLTLGIPGSPTAAVLLGGLLIHGMFPGPDLFTVHAKTTWTFIDALLVSQILMVIFGLIISRYSYFINKISSHYMAAAVLILAVFGTYTVQNSFSDVLVMMLLGTTMYVGSKHGFSPAPVVLGIILGPIAETNFLQGQIIAQTRDGFFPYFFSGLTNLIIITLCFVSIAVSASTEIRNSRKNRMVTS